MKKSYIYIVAAIAAAAILFLVILCCSWNKEPETKTSSVFEQTDINNTDAPEESPAETAAAEASDPNVTNDDPDYVDPDFNEDDYRITLTTHDDIDSFIRGFGENGSDLNSLLNYAYGMDLSALSDEDKEYLQERALALANTRVVFSSKSVIFTSDTEQIEYIYDNEGWKFTHSGNDVSEVWMYTCNVNEWPATAVALPRLYGGGTITRTSWSTPDQKTEIDIMDINSDTFESYFTRVAAEYNTDVYETTESGWQYYQAVNPDNGLMVQINYSAEDQILFITLVG